MMMIMMMQKEGQLFFPGMNIGKQMFSYQEIDITLGPRL